MKHLSQKLCTKTDSFSYSVIGEETPTYLVDSHGCLFEKGKEVGRFRLQSEQWYLVIDGQGVFMTGPPNGLHKLPEFELKALTKLVNKD